MFRRIENTLEPDPSFPANLKELGFFINSSGDIRMINAPEKPYVYHATNNDRVNEEVEQRLSYLGLNCIHLPDFAMTKPNGPHVPILAPLPEVLKTHKRIIVLVNDTMQDLGILAYRQLQRELGINGGSVVNFVKEMIKRSSADNDAEKDASIFRDGYVLEDKATPPALIVLNTGQLLYSHKYDQAMTLRSWSAMPRKSVAHDMIRIHDEENRVPGHRDAKDHVKTVFDQVICNPDRVSADAEVYVIAIEDGTESVLKLLTDNFDKYGTRITAMALIHSLVDDSQVKDRRVRAFLHQRPRQWKFSDLTSDPQHCTDLPNSYDQQADQCASPKDTPSIMQSTKHISWHESISTGAIPSLTKALNRLAVSITPSAYSTTRKEENEEKIAEWSSGQAVICPTFAGGNNSVGECIFTYPPVQHAILSFFQDVAQDPLHYRNPPGLKAYTVAPQPSPDHPLALSPINNNGDDDDDIGTNFGAPTLQMTPEQAELEEARERLAELRVAFTACPDGISELVQGRAMLGKKIKVMETRVDDLENKTKKALLLGGGGGDHGVLNVAGEEREEKDKKKGGNWKMQVEGPKVPFAGTMVDSELLKAAGLVESAEEGLGLSAGAGAVQDQYARGGHEDEEKAFV
ncbi:hypothetical protein AA0119_g4890 [Alternaria tenuissima]|uniref:Arb2 domain-containing protein n=1 Tax=Alternaria tenuissima TaxID=119927 RepID=A0ABY0GCW3_9PLEO|nr:hypothetical protein AA0119_g4890 [Alternaria tenuissima]